MERLGICEKDISEKFIRSSGRGGQKLNKTSNCVYVKHNPSGTEVKCSLTRSRDTNRFLARRILADKIEESLFLEIEEKKNRIEKIRRRKRRRPKKSREKILKNKRMTAEKKHLRKRVYEDDNA
ncbi:MAG: peptide chain release factor-like protein [Elusimicrobia bacterium]|nr:peptide chain release factor-like protein [Elusimicrobiota bacterium]